MTHPAMSDLSPPERTLMFQEAAQAPLAVARQLQMNRPAVQKLVDFLRRYEPRAVLLCGRGSSDNAAVYAKYLLESRLGLLVSSSALSISSLYQRTLNLKDTVCIAISQSGASPDLLATVAAAQRGGALVIALVNVEDSPLARVANEVIPLGAGGECSVAATKSFITALTAIAQLVAVWSDDAQLGAALERMPQALEQAWQHDWSAAVPPLQQARNMYVIGRGYGWGIAREAALKLKETSGIHAEAYSGAEVKHGPMAIVQPGFTVLALAQNDATRAGMQALGSDLCSAGATLITGGQWCSGALSLPLLEVDPLLDPILFIQAFYKLANAVALARGCNPDVPPHLKKVTQTL